MGKRQEEQIERFGFDPVGPSGKKQKPKDINAIMKTIIDEISTDCDFALANNAQAKDSFDMFVNKVYSSSNVSKQFDAAFHSLDFKEEFNYNIHKVDYYGEQMSYLSFLIQGGI